MADEQLIEVEPVMSGDQDKPQSIDPSRFTWSQLDVLDIITADQSGGGDCKMEVSEGRGRRRAVENDNSGEEEESGSALSSKLQRLWFV